jgi:hypothetical protein
MMKLKQVTNLDKVTAGLSQKPVSVTLFTFFEGGIKNFLNRLKKIEMLMFSQMRESSTIFT